LNNGTTIVKKHSSFNFGQVCKMLEPWLFFFFCVYFCKVLKEHNLQLWTLDMYDLTLVDVLFLFSILSYQLTLVFNLRFVSS
jgi:hypothetical protein